LAVGAAAQPLVRLCRSLRSAIYATPSLVHERWDTGASCARCATRARPSVSLLPTDARARARAGLQDPPALRTVLLGARRSRRRCRARARRRRDGVTETYFTDLYVLAGDYRGPPLFCTRVCARRHGRNRRLRTDCGRRRRSLHTATSASSRASGTCASPGLKSDTIITVARTRARGVRGRAAEHPRWPIPPCTAGRTGVGRGGRRDRRAAGRGFTAEELRSHAARARAFRCPGGDFRRRPLRAPRPASAAPPPLELIADAARAGSNVAAGRQRLDRAARRRLHPPASG